MRLKTTFLIVLLISINASVCIAKSKLRLGNFELGGIRFKPTDTSWETNAFIDFAWTPMWDMGGLAVHGSFQLTSARDRQTKRILVTGYQGFLLVHVYTILAFEAGAGLQTWYSTDAGTFPIVSGNLLLRVAEDSFDRVYFGYGHYLHSITPSHVIRAGSSFTF